MDLEIINILVTLYLPIMRLALPFIVRLEEASVINDLGLAEAPINIMQRFVSKRACLNYSK